MWGNGEEDETLPDNPDAMIEEETNYSHSYDSNDDLDVIPHTPRLSKKSGTSKSTLSLFSKKLFKRGKKDNDDVEEDSLTGSTELDGESVKRYTMRDEKEDWRYVAMEIMFEQ